MKINYILIAIIYLFLSFNATFSQNIKEISGYIQYHIISNGIKPIPTQFYFSNSKSISISSKTSNSTAGMNSSSENGISLTLPFGDNVGKQIYRDIENRIFICRIPNSYFSEEFVVKENWVEIDWKIKKQTKQIGSYIATKATGSFRGRDYTVWFTYDIPVPFGPWKLYGLPGLILEGEDSERIMQFRTSKIMIPYNDVSEYLKIPTAKTNMTHKEQVFLVDNIDVIVAKKMNAKAPKGVTIRPGKKNANKRNQMPEKIFEWEINAKNEKRK